MTEIPLFSNWLLTRIVNISYIINSRFDTLKEGSILRTKLFKKISIKTQRIFFLSLKIHKGQFEEVGTGKINNLIFSMLLKQL